MKRKKLNHDQIRIMESYGLNENNTSDAFSAEYEYGEVLMEAGEQLENILILSRGSVRVCAQGPDGRSLILCYYVQKGVLGDMELLDENQRIVNSVIASSPCEAIALPCQNNRSRLENNPAFMKHLARDLAEKLTETSRNYASAILDSASQRLARYIDDSARNGVFSGIMTDAAMSTGMSYRHMYRLLDQMCREGVLEKQTEGYRILDEMKLKKIEQGK